MSEFRPARRLAGIEKSALGARHVSPADTSARWLEPPWFGSSVQKNCASFVSAQGRSWRRTS